MVVEGSGMLKREDELGHLKTNTQKITYKKHKFGIDVH
jgi:hypothetical protein